VLRRVVIAAAVAAVSVVPAAPAADTSALMPGVTYTRDVEFTSHGPVVAHVVTAPRPVGLYSLRPALARNVVQGRSRLATIQRGSSRQGTSVAVDANLSALTDGLIRSGVVDVPPVDTRSTLGIAADGTLRVDRVLLSGNWRGTGQRWALVLNQPAAPNRATLYTRAWGAATPAEPRAVEAVLSPFPAASPNGQLVGAVTDLHQGGGTPIPVNGAVLVGRDAFAGRLASEAPVGSRVAVRLDLAPEWRNVPDAVGCGPVLVRAGRPVFDAGESFAPAYLSRWLPRTAVGQLADGRVLLVVVDGRPGYSVGMTNFELALTMVRLGAVTSCALDGGTASTLAYEGRVLNRPLSSLQGPPIGDALVLSYAGVYAAPPAAEVVSPNGDGADDAQSFSYKLVRAATVSATLRGPDGSRQTLEAGARGAGLHSLPWQPSAAAEGRWTFRVDAADDLGRSSSAERRFDVNNTLGFLSVRPGSRVAVGFTLARPARVTVTLQTRRGRLVRTLLDRALRTGKRSFAWSGRGLARRGYVVRVTARNALGLAALEQPFSLRRG
jgi:hypothetical protein